MDTGGDARVRSGADPVVWWSILTAAAVLVTWLALLVLGRVSGPGALIGGIAFAFIGVALLLAALVPGRTPPRRLVLTGGSFVAPAGRRLGVVVASQILIGGQLAADTAFFWTFLDREDGGLSPADVAVPRTIMTGMFACYLVLVATIATRVLSGFPYVVFSPAGLTRLDVFGTAVFPWESMQSGVSPDTRWPSTGMKLVLARPELIRRRGLSPTRRLQVTYLSVDPDLLSRAIGFYASYPDERAAIGTEAGYARLLTALNRPPVPAA